MTTARKSISKSVRFEIFKRDGFTCWYCNRVDIELCVDHVVPVASGGSDDPTNLVTSCVDCNSGKSDIPLHVKRYDLDPEPDDALGWFDPDPGIEPFRPIDLAALLESVEEAYYRVMLTPSESERFEDACLSHPMLDFCGEVEEEDEIERYQAALMAEEEAKEFGEES